MHPYQNEVTKGRWQSAFFDTVGDESGDSCICNLNGSASPVDVLLTAPADAFLYVNQLTGSLACTRRLNDEGFGSSRDPLDNGLLLLQRYEDGTERLMTNQLPIRRNMDFAVYSFFTRIVNPKTLSWRFQITDDGTPFRLRPHQSLLWRVQDDLSSTKYRCRCMHMRAGFITVPEAYR